jgi:hypothetical protein
MFGFLAELQFEEGAGGNPYESLQVLWDGYTIGLLSKSRRDQVFVVLDPYHARLLANWIQTALGDEPEEPSCE